MCGITGWVDLAQDSASVQVRDEAVLRSMCERIRHRGPDSEGIFLGRSVALGARRLAVLDLLTGDQPIFDESRSTVAVLNGEIYNFRELRDDMVRRGHSFRSSTDSEVLPHLYEEFGTWLVEKLNGMFAFAIWDEKRRRLVLGRDRFGEKPLYYGTFQGKLIFASEIKAILAHPDVTAALDEDALRQYLVFDCVPAPLSIYKGIFKLPAGHFLTVENGAVEIERYWDLDHRKRQPAPSIDEAAAELGRLLDDSTRRRMVSDVPVGVFLSGGIDSSVVAAYASRHSAGQLKTFCIGFEDDDYSEASPAAAVASYLGTEHHEERLTGSAASALVPQIAGWLDEPLADPSVVPTFYLARFARSMVTVALGGDGADELFGGYPSYYAHKLMERYETFPAFVKKRIVRRLIRMTPHDTNETGLGFLGRRFLRAVEIQDPIARHFSFFGSFTTTEEAALLGMSVVSGDALDLFAEPLRWAAGCRFDTDVDSDNLVETMQFLDTKLYLGEDILTKVDRASMAVSLEVRSPFLDQRIAEFAAGLPRNYKLKCDSAKFALGRTGKYVLKRAAAPLLPKRVTGRKKNGFIIPTATWINGPMRELIYDQLSPSSVRTQGIFDANYVQRLLDEHARGRANHAKKIWSLLMFELWRKNWISQASSSSTMSAQGARIAA